jgi:hypothetical protein
MRRLPRTTKRTWTNKRMDKLKDIVTKKYEDEYRILIKINPHLKWIMGDIKHHFNNPDTQWDLNLFTYLTFIKSVNPEVFVAGLRISGFMVKHTKHGLSIVKGKRK